jgi:CarD family transcriptional regulator
MASVHCHRDRAFSRKGLASCHLHAAPIRRRTQGAMPERPSSAAKKAQKQAEKPQVHCRTRRNPLYFWLLLIGAYPTYPPYFSGGHVTFQVGDKVIYPNHGLGVVQGIETKTILGTTCGFYHLKMVANETTVLVPVDNVDGVGLRRAIGDEEIDRLFTLLGDGKIDNHQNWKGRFKDNSDRMRTGSIYDVVEVLKSLTFLARSKNLSFREKRMLDRAKFLVISEISEVAHEKTAQIEEKVDRALERCFLMKNRSIARAKAAKAVPVPTTRVTVRRTARAS